MGATRDNRGQQGGIGADMGPRGLIWGLRGRRVMGRFTTQLFEIIIERLYYIYKMRLRYDNTFVSET